VSRRDYPHRPWVGVGVVVWWNGRVLLVQRAKAPRRGQWGLPGGAQHLGETVFEAAVREVREETGLEVTPYGVVTVVDSIVRDDRGSVQWHYTLVEVGATCSGGTPVVGDDAAAAGWYTLTEAEGLVEWDETLRVIRLAEALRPA